MAVTRVRYTNAWHRDEGAPWPLGVQWIADEQAFNFAVYSKHATSVKLLLFQNGQFESPCASFLIQSPKHKSGPIWHLRVGHTELNDARNLRTSKAPSKEFFHVADAIGRNPNVSHGG